MLFSKSSNGHIGLGASHGEVAEGHTICIASIGWDMRMSGRDSRIAERGVRDGGDGSLGGSSVTVSCVLCWELYDEITVNIYRAGVETCVA